MKSLKRFIVKIINKCRDLKNKKEYRHFGKNSYIRKPMLIQGKSYISIGDNCQIFDGIRLQAIDKWREKK